MKKLFSKAATRESLGVHSEAGEAAKPGVNLDLVESQIKRMKDAVVIDVDLVEPDPEQPRKHFDEVELQQLADSLNDQGQLQPICVWKDRSSESPKYIIIAGERRWRASKLGGRTTINAIIEKKRLTTEEIRVRQFAENAVRSDFRPVEKSLFYKEMLESTGVSTRELAKRLHTSAAGISLGR